MGQHSIAWGGRRSPVLGNRGVAAASQPAAARAGLRILDAGGNAADAAVAAAAVLGLVEPTSTGLGGDCFCLFHEASTGEVHALNGSGRAPAGLALADVAEGWERQGVHAATVPGAAAGWEDALARHGRMDLASALGPAIELAEGGTPITPVIARAWASQEELLREQSPNGGELLLGGRAPRAGEIWRNAGLARTMRDLAEGGAAAFYEGAAGRAIVEVLDGLGGAMTAADLASHRSTFEPPISARYGEATVWECRPNGQGLTALLALRILDGMGMAELPARSAAWAHRALEALRLAFADARARIADPAISEVPVEALLSEEYIAQRRALISEDAALELAEAGELPGLPGGSDTVYLCTVDEEGNACSFINSNYEGFGTGIVPRGCGFSLQNRGAGFSLEAGHPNALAGGKRPYHTIMPGMLTDDAGLIGPFGVMGGWNQPQGHAQVVMHLVDRGLEPQNAIDEPRFSIYRDPPNGEVWIEEGFPLEAMSELAQMGHRVRPAAGAVRNHVVGKGQIIAKDRETGTWWAGSDGRADGCAMAQ